MQKGGFEGKSDYCYQNKKIIMDSTNERELTFGEKAVGLTFNPSNDPNVQSCKKDFAKIIDALNNMRTVTSSAEVKRMVSVAITEAQTAQMWAVKAITWKD